MGKNWTKEQVAAIETTGSNIIVSAGAGSGKTAVLTERVFQKLKKGISVDELLILTFTKAAASEMKERIRKAIIKDDSLKSQLYKIDNSYITTFDSFALSVVKKYSYLLGISKNISIVEASVMELKKAEAMENVFKELYEIKDKNFLKLISDFCLKDDNIMQNHLISLNDKLDMRYDKQEYLKNYLSTNFSNDSIQNDITEYEKLIQQRITDIQTLLNELSHFVENDYLEKINEEVYLLFEATTYDEIKESLPIKLPRLPNGSSMEAKEKKDQIGKELKNLYTYLIYSNTTEIVEEIISTKPYVQAIIEIITRFDDCINSYKHVNDVYEFTDISKMAIKVLDNNPTLCLEMKHYFKEILLDEYQDTNDLQEQFITMISNDNVYMVGDIKQSIYRFRNANPNLFKEKYNMYKENKDGIKIDLMKNFRSRREVLDNINVIFNHIMNHQIGGADYQDGHQMLFGNTAYERDGKTGSNHDFEFHTYDYDASIEYKKEEIEIFSVANDIKNKVSSHYQIFDKDKNEKRDIEYSDFVILLDRSKNFTLYKKIFEYLGIPLMIYQDESLHNSYDLDILKNILKLLVKKMHNSYDTEFKYSYISVARSYLFSIPDSEIFETLTSNTFNNSKIMEYINDIYKQIPALSSTNILELIISQFKFYEKMITVGNIEEGIIRLEYLLNLSDNLSNLGYDISDVLEYIKAVSKTGLSIKYSLNKTDNNAVKIMTIHKSKGLEYHICYFPGLYEKFNTLEIKERFCYSKEYGLIVPAFRQGIKTTIYKKMYSNKYLEEEISEKIRLFYVALTRAKEKMIFVLPSKELYNYPERGVVDDYTRKHYQSFLDIIISIKPYLEDYNSIINLDKLSLTKEYNFIKKNNNNQILVGETNDNIIVEELNHELIELEEQTFSNRKPHLITTEEHENLTFGKQLHFLFENINFKNPNIEKLPINSFEKQKLQGFLNQAIFKEDLMNFYHEYEFIYTSDSKKYHGIIDLILEYPDRYIIIDYKTKNILDESYRNQLLGYQTYLKTKTKKAIDVYLYSILDEKLYQIEA